MKKRIITGKESSENIEKKPRRNFFKEAFFSDDDDDEDDDDEDEDDEDEDNEDEDNEDDEDEDDENDDNKDNREVEEDNDEEDEEDDKEEKSILKRGLFRKKKQDNIEDNKEEYDQTSDERQSSKKISDEKESEENDEEEDEDDDQEEDDSYYQSPEYKRDRRHQRRVRNQLLALLTMVVLVGAVLICVVTAGGHFYSQYQEKKQADSLAAQLASMSSAEETVVLSEPETASQETGSQLDEVVNAAIKEMPIEDKVAALFMVTPDELTGVSGVMQAGDATQKALQQYKVGGIYYTAANIKNADQLTQMLSKTETMDQNLFFAVEEQGGDLSPVAKKLSKDQTAAPGDIGSSGNADKAYQSGKTIGTYLKKYGFNLDLAPISDVITSTDGSSLGKHSYGKDAATVGTMASGFIKGLSEQNIYSCVRTFPGLGGTSASTKNGMVTTERSEADMKTSEFVAYKKAITAGSEFAMVGTVSAPNLTGDNTPCCLSKAAIDVLRNDLGFQGIVITDSMSESSITQYYKADEAAVKAIKAGADMILMPENLKTAYDGVLKAVKDGTLEESRIDESLLRIYRVKYKNKVASISAAGSQTGSTEATAESTSASAAASTESKSAGASSETKQSADKKSTAK